MYWYINWRRENADGEIVGNGRQTKYPWVLHACFCFVAAAVAFFFKKPLYFSFSFPELFFIFFSIEVRSITLCSCSCFSFLISPTQSLNHSLTHSFLHDTKCAVCAICYDGIIIIFFFFITCLSYHGLIIMGDAMESNGTGGDQVHHHYHHSSSSSSTGRLAIKNIYLSICLFIINHLTFCTKATYFSKYQKFLSCHVHVRYCAVPL